MPDRRQRFVLCGLSAIALVASSPTRAAVIAVDGTTCGLGNAILSANGDAAVGGCTAGAGADTLMLGVNVVLTAPLTASVEGGPSGLPAISSKILIAAGAGSVVERSSAMACNSEEPTAFRFLEVAAGGDLELAGLTLRNGCVAAVGAGAIASGGAVLVLAGGALQIDDCEVEGNTARGGPEGVSQSAGAARGGAVAVLDGSLEIVGSTFSANEVIGFDARGGALAVEGGDLRAITWSRFEGNRATPAPAEDFMATTPTSGGAIALRDVNAGSLAHLLIAGNLAGTEVLAGGSASGGGIAVTGGRLQELRDTLFSANSARAGGASFLAFADGLGGGLANSGFIDTIARATYSANLALGAMGGEGRGGGLDNTGRIQRIVAASFIANTAEGGVGVHNIQGPSVGGGIGNLGSIAEIAASTFTLNECPVVPNTFISYSAGGGIYSAIPPPGSGPGGAIVLVNNLLAGNDAVLGDDCWSSAGFGSAGWNFAQAPDASCTFTSTGDILGEEAQLLPPADNGCALTLPDGSCAPSVAFPPTSPAADAGRCGEAGTELDGRGAVRPLDLAGVPNAAGGDGCDIGAFEFDGALATVHLGLNVAESGDPVYGGTGAGNLVYTLALASLGSAAAEGIAVAVALPLPAGVTLDSATPSSGSWDGATWTVSSLPSGGRATLTFVLTVGLGTTGGAEVLSLSAVVTAATGHGGEFAADVESTSVREAVLHDGFESGDTAAWSFTSGGD